jgi:hypothetical protein
MTVAVGPKERITGGRRMDQRRVVASEVVAQICGELQYSRGHVASLLRKHARFLEAKRNRSGRWFMPEDSAHALKLIVLRSGPRYKLGEKGSRGNA